MSRLVRATRHWSGCVAFATLGLVAVSSTARAQQSPPTVPQPPVPQLPTTQPPPVGGLPQSIMVPPPPTREQYNPFPQLPPTTLDEASNGIGLAQQMTRVRGLQGRVLWIDATANIDRYNTATKVADLVTKIKNAGFNTIVFDVKPIVGQTVYPSQFAPKLPGWQKDGNSQVLPADFDPLQEMVSQTRLQKMSLLVNFNAFSEGHTYFRAGQNKGPGYDHPEWQTVLYVPDLRLRRDDIGTPGFAVYDRPNPRPEIVSLMRDLDALIPYTDTDRLKERVQDLIKARFDQNVLITLVDKTDTVQAQFTPSAFSTLSIEIPAGGAAFLAQTPAGINFIRLNAAPGLRMRMDNTPAYVPIGQRAFDQIPLMTNPHSPEVRQRLQSMLAEVVLKYEVDGIIFDDRLRYAGLNADFSDTTRKEFETYVGKPVRWPDDIFRYQIDFPSMERHEIHGPYYDAWLTFRALNMRNFLAEAIRTVKTNRPSAIVATYVGSNYPDYPEKGANWAADDLIAGYRFLNDSYRRTGWANMVDFVTTGCYYTVPTISDALLWGTSVGESVEAAGQFSNRAVNDATFSYAAISLEQYKNRTDQLKKALQAAAASTQGIMVFDLSHDFDLFIPTFTEVFQKPVLAPHQTPGLVTEMRTVHDAQKASGTQPPAVILYRGASGTGF